MNDRQPRITAIKPTQRDPARMSIRAGGKYIGTMSHRRIVELDLTVGMAWTDDLADRVTAMLGADKATRYAMNALNQRMFSTGELIDRLRRRGYEAAVIDEVVEKMTERGFLDDQAYGRSVIRAERSRKPAGPRLLRYKLIRKKLPRELIDRLIDEAEQDHDGAESARQLAEQRLQTVTMQKLEPAVRRRRLYGLLARRGFSPDDIRSAMSNLPGLTKEKSR